MRLKLLDKGLSSTVAFDVSKNKEKNFERAIICIKEGERIYKVLSLIASKKDGSISVFFDYCKEKQAFIMRHSHKYKGGMQMINRSQVTDEFKVEFTVDNTAKLSLHRSGFVQISGKGIKSGINEETGRPKGVGVFSSPLDKPVASGPTFGFICWGLVDGFEVLKKYEKGFQYVILDKENNDFTERRIEKDKLLNSYVLEFFIFPKEANQYIYEHEDKPYINHEITNYSHNPGALFAHPVIDIRNFEGVIALFPVLQWTGFSDKNICGYSIGSPGGSDSMFDESRTGYNFHLFCPANNDYSMLGIERIKSLKYE